MRGPTADSSAGAGRSELFPAVRPTLRAVMLCTYVNDTARHRLWRESLVLEPENLPLLEHEPSARDVTASSFLCLSIPFRIAAHCSLVSSFCSGAARSWPRGPYTKLACTLDAKPWLGFCTAHAPFPPCFDVLSCRHRHAQKEQYEANTSAESCHTSAGSVPALHLAL